MTRCAIVLSLILAAAPSYAARRRAASVPPPFPPCATVEGTPAVAVSRDGGATLIKPSQQLAGIGYSYGLAAIGWSDLLATHKQTLSLSTDAGCTWTAIAALEGEQFYRITPTAGRSYVWDDNREYLARFDHQSRTLTKLKPPTAFVGLGVDPNAANHVLAGGSDGSVWESNDSGDTWTLRGSLPAQSFPIYYRVAFDSHDVNHIVAGVAGNGAYRSTDGGRNWFRSLGLGASSVNVFSIVISDADPNTVWAMGIDLAESDANVPSRGRHIYLSRDGGATFTPVVDASATLTLVNQPVMAAHPTDRNVVYFIFGTYFQGYGTDIYRYDDATRSVVTFHNDYNDIDSIAFSTRDPNVMYFGLETERLNAP